jgi:uncharacterized protein (DUF1697 family)
MLRTGVSMAGRHVALIRGINVGKAKRVAMADLRRLMEASGHRDVRTLLNSGNVIFTATGTPQGLGETIERAMSERLGVSGHVAVLTAADFSTAVKENPLGKRASDPARLLVVFSPDPKRLTLLRPLTRQDWSPEAFGIGRQAAYLWCSGGILASRLAEAVGKLLGEGATTRNWATVLRIQAALQPDARSTGAGAARRPLR